MKKLLDSIFHVSVGGRVTQGMVHVQIIPVTCSDWRLICKPRPTPVDCRVWEVPNCRIGHRLGSGCKKDCDLGRVILAGRNGNNFATGTAIRMMGVHVNCAHPQAAPRALSGPGPEIRFKQGTHES